MGMLTKGSIDIAAPRAEVFRWLTERDKLTAWMGGAGSMPEHVSDLRVGYTSQGTMPSPGGGTRPTGLIVTDWDPPTTFSMTITYPGGDSLSTYTLTDIGADTHLELASDTDWAEPDNSAVDKALEGQNFVVRHLVEGMVHRQEAKLAQGDFDASTAAIMQKSLEASLAKLKTLIEKG